jgi:hypothetical protein
MPPRLTHDEVNNYLSKYGFIIHDEEAQYRNNKAKMTLYDLVGNKKVNISLGQFKQKVKSGKIQTVDPFLNTFKDIDTELLYTTPTRPNDKLSRFAESVIPEFTAEPLPIKLEAVKLFEDFVKRMKKHETIEIFNQEANQSEKN